MDVTDLGDRIKDELAEIQRVRAQIISLLEPLRPWQQKSITDGLFWYRPKDEH